jgi:hypothetical protein
VAVLKCPRCDAPWTPDDVYCRACGQFVSADPPRAPGANDAAAPELVFPWGAHRPAEGESLTLGRAFPPYAKQLAAYPNVGRVHARIEAAGGVLRVTDLKSQNRTFIDDVPLPADEPTELRSGQVLRLAASLEVQVR